MDHSIETVLPLLSLGPAVVTGHHQSGAPAAGWADLVFRGGLLLLRLFNEQPDYTAPRLTPHTVLPWHAVHHIGIRPASEVAAIMPQLLAEAKRNTQRWVRPDGDGWESAEVNRDATPPGLGEGTVNP
jgi:hypothetical protein